MYAGRTPVRGLGATQDIIRSQKADYNAQQQKWCSRAAVAKGNRTDATLKVERFCQWRGNAEGKVL